MPEAKSTLPRFFSSPRPAKIYAMKLHFLLDSDLREEVMEVLHRGKDEALGPTRKSDLVREEVLQRWMRGRTVPGQPKPRRRFVERHGEGKVGGRSHSRFWVDDAEGWREAHDRLLEEMHEREFQEAANQAGADGVAGFPKKDFSGTSALQALDGHWEPSCRHTSGLAIYGCDAVWCGYCKLPYCWVRDKNSVGELPEECEALRLRSEIERLASRLEEWANSIHCVGSPEGMREDARRARHLLAELDELKTRSPRRET